MYIDSFIVELIKTKKKVTERPQRTFTDDGQYKRNNFKANSEDEKYCFSIFLRKHNSLLDEFSIGLIYLPAGENPIILLRMNGNHGIHKNPDNSLIDGFHIHQATQVAIENGHKPETLANKTTDYQNFETALDYFLKYINLEEANQYFPFLNDKWPRFLEVE